MALIDRLDRIRAASRSTAAVVSPPREHIVVLESSGQAHTVVRESNLARLSREGRMPDVPWARLNEEA